MHYAEVSRPGPRRPAQASGAIWVGRIGVGAAAFVVGSALGHASDPLQLGLAACLGGLAIAAAVTRLRWFLVAVLFLLVAYVPDVLATRSAAHGLIAIVLAGTVVGWVARRERFAIPRELLAVGALGLAYLLASAGASDRTAAAAETLDLVSYAAIVALLMVLLDTPAWLRRAMWAVAMGVGLLAFVAILQQVTKTYGSSYGGFASVLPAGDAMRSAGPLNPNPFGQILATSAVIAFYLARIQTRTLARAFAATIALACVVGVVYTQSRAALIALLIVAIAIGALQGVRLRVLAVAACGALALGSLVIPHSLAQRVDELSDGTSANASFRDNNSLRGRTSENLAGLDMWRDHPLIGVGPDNFEVHYETYSAQIGIDQRAQARGAHNLYLESLAETGVLGAAAFFTVIWLAVSGAWRARSRLEGPDALLGEGLAVALGAFLICALTLHSAYARYEWIFLGLGLAAGHLVREAGPMTALVVAIASAALVAWVYAGYPLSLALLGRLRPRPRRRAPLVLPLSVIVAAHDEVEVIAEKVANVLASDYPAPLLELIVASDGSEDGTVEAARRAGATLVLDLPRTGKLMALNHGVEAATGEVLVFTDADSMFEPGTLRRLVSNFADEQVGGVAANVVRVVEEDGRPVARGEGLYWRYERLLKRLEDRVGSVVSASGHLYAVRRSFFTPSAQTAGTDDFLISSAVVRQGGRLAFDEHARVLVATPEEGGTELRRKVRVMNRGLRSAMALGDGLLPTRTGLYAFEVVFHKLLRRFVGFFLVALLASSVALAASDPTWWLLLGPQLVFYALAAAGALLAHTRWGRLKPLWVPYFFCLANGAAALAVLSLLAGVRFERWEPVGMRGGVARG